MCTLFMIHCQEWKLVFNELKSNVKWDLYLCVGSTPYSAGRVRLRVRVRAVISQFGFYIFLHTVELFFIAY